MYDRMVGFLLGLPVFIQLHSKIPPVPLSALALPLLFLWAFFRQPKLSKVELLMSVFALASLATTFLKLIMGYFIHNEMEVILFTTQTFVWMAAFTVGKASRPNKMNKIVSSMVWAGSLYCVAEIIRGEFDPYETIAGPLIAYQVWDHVPALLAVLAILAVGLARTGRAVYWIHATLLLWATLNLDADTAKAVVVAGIYLVLVWGRRRICTTRAVLLSLLGPLALVLAHQLDVVNLDFGSKERILTLNTRTSIWQRYILQTFSSLTTLLLGDTEIDVPTYFGELRITAGHNQYIDTLSRQGLFALVVYIVLVWIVLRICAKTLFISQGNHVLNAATIVVVLAFTLNALTLPSMNQPIFGIPIWFFFGLIYRHYRDWRATLLARAALKSSSPLPPTRTPGT